MRDFGARFGFDFIPIPNGIPFRQKTPLKSIFTA